MRLHNLKDAGSLIPQWGTACLLNCLFLGLYGLAYYGYEAKPAGIVVNACTAAILLSLVLAVTLLVSEIIQAKAGEVGQAASKGVITGLNLSWTITCLAFLCYIGWVPVSTYVVGNVGLVVSGAGAIALVVTGYFAVTPNATKSDEAQESSHALSLPTGFQPSLMQQPTFQVTIADMTRLVCHQAGRAIGYTGSNVQFDDSFSLDLDTNERVARVFSNSNLVHTEDFMFWRLHMLMIGSAAEKVLTGKSSHAALDDLTSFDELASKYLTLRVDHTFNPTPINVHEAQIKASRISMLRKTVYDRCQAACLGNRHILTDLVKLMRTRSVLTYGDISGLLERVKMPEGFPLAQFDDEEILQKALLTYDDHQEVTLESFLHSESAGTSLESNAGKGSVATGPATSEQHVDRPTHVTVKPSSDMPNSVVSMTA